MNLLKLIECATCLLSASNYATHSDIQSVFLGIQEHLIQYKNDDEFSQCIMANAIYQKLEDYLPILDELSQISSLLDLRAKLSVFKGENEINKAKDLILKLNGYLLTSTSTIASISDDITSTRNFFRQLQNNNNFTSTISSQVYNIQGELDRYLAMPLENQIDPLLWWQSQQQGFSILSQMARDYLCIQATSVASEQAFSVAGLVISPLRNRLEAETARATLCLKSWFCQGVCEK